MQSILTIHVTICIFLFQFIIYHFPRVYAINGQNIRQANENEFPYVVCIVRYSSEDNWPLNLACSGTLLTNMLVLTAEQCVVDAQEVQYEISIGENIQNGVKFYPIWWVSHDQWCNVVGCPIEAPWNDIALIKIFGYPPEIFPTLIGLHRQISNLFGFNTDIVGCGRTRNNVYPEKLYTGNVNVIGLNACRQMVSGLQGVYIPINEKYYCSIGVPYAYIDKGDNGGPLLYFGTVVGINIARCPVLQGGVHEGQLNIHINLYYYRNFLNSITEGNTMTYDNIH